MKKYSYIKEMKTSELQDKLVEEVSALGKIRLNHNVSPLENPIQMREKRRVIARLNTELTARSKNTK